MKTKPILFGIITLAALITICMTSCDLFQEPDVAVSGVSLNKSSTSLNVGATETLTATISPNNATNRNLSWTSSDTAIATVSSGGVVTGVAAGSAVITVSTANGGFTASCNVTVASLQAQVARPNGNGGVSVEANGNLRIAADLWLFNEAEENPQLRRADAGFSHPVSVYVGNNTWEIPDGIKDGRLDISIDISLINNSSLYTLGYEYGDTEGFELEGANVLLGALALYINQNQYYGPLGLFVNPELRQHEGINGGRPFLYGEFFEFFYSMGNSSLKGSYTDDEESITEEINVDVRLASGWNSVSLSYTYNLPVINHIVQNGLSKSPPAAGARWILRYSTYNIGELDGTYINQSNSSYKIVIQGNLWTSLIDNVNWGRGTFTLSSNAVSGSSTHAWHDGMWVPYTGDTFLAINEGENSFTIIDSTGWDQNFLGTYLRQ